MTFHPDALGTFLTRFDRAAPAIRAFDGCRHLDLWQDAAYPNCCTTHSHWDSPEALEAYRRSDLFETTWANVKPLFAARPTAQSYHVLRANERIVSSGTDGAA